MSSAHSIPTWLNTSVTSEKHIHQVIRVLENREGKRCAARRASRNNACGRLQPAPPINTSCHLQTHRKNPSEVPSHVIDHYAITTGSSEAVQRFNRYSDVIPFDRTRVVLYNGRVEHGGLQNHAEGRYLNASWVLERAGNKWWIASQAPVRHSSHAFLSIMLQSHLFPPNGVTLPKKSRVRTVVQLTTDIEGGRRKADPYFPSQVGQSVLISPEPGCSAHVLKVTLLASTWIDYAHCVESTVSIVPTVTPSQSDREDAKSGQDGNRETIFKHLLYTSWPDHGVPAAEDRQSLLEFMHLVDSTNRRTVQSDQSEGEDMDSDPPIIVGCSAGIGRTGSFIALSSILRKSGILPPALQPTSSSAIPASPLGPLPDGLEDDLVAVEIDCLREQRPGMVQRPEQVVLVYQSLVDVFNSSPFA